VNLIPFNRFPHPLPSLQRGGHRALSRDLLIRGGVIATIRRTRGDDIERPAASSSAA